MTQSARNLYVYHGNQILKSSVQVRHGFFCYFKNNWWNIESTLHCLFLMMHIFPLSHQISLVTCRYQYNADIWTPAPPHMGALMTTAVYTENSHGGPQGRKIACGFIIDLNPFMTCFLYRVYSQCTLWHDLKLNTVMLSLLHGSISQYTANSMTLTGQQTMEAVAL